MGSNFHTPWADDTTLFKASSMNPALASLDQAISYFKNVIVHCDGNIGYDKATGELSWYDTLRILFVRSDGKSTENTIAAGSITLVDNQFAYVDLNETNGTVLTVQKATVSTGAASNFKTYNRLVLAYRNATADTLYLVGLEHKFGRPYLVSMYWPGVPTADEILCVHTFTDVAAIFPADVPHSKANAQTAATAQTVLSLKKDGVQFGTVTFNGGATRGNFTAASKTVFDENDVLTIIAPNPADATLAGINVVLRGERTFLLPVTTTTSSSTTTSTSSTTSSTASTSSSTASSTSSSSTSTTTV